MISENPVPKDMDLMSNPCQPASLSLAGHAENIIGECQQNEGWAFRGCATRLKKRSHIIFKAAFPKQNLWQPSHMAHQ
jgi:hypothetical protein